MKLMCAESEATCPTKAMSTFSGLLTNNMKTSSASLAKLANGNAKTPANLLFFDLLTLETDDKCAEKSHHINDIATHLS